MTKMSLEWHKERLENMKKYREDKASRLKTLSLELDKIDEGIQIKEKQIQRAIKLNKDSFDEERFNPE